MLKKDCRCRRDREENQLSHQPPYIRSFGIGRRRRHLHGRQITRTYEHQLNAGLCGCGDGNKGRGHQPDFNFLFKMIGNQ